MASRRTLEPWLLAAMVIASAAPARADVVWPALYLVGGLATWWVVLCGLAIEMLVVHRLVRRTWSIALAYTLAANFVSVVAGIVLIPILGLVWEVTLGQVAMAILQAGTFNPAAWVATGLLAVASNVVLETVVLVKAFRQRPWQRVLPPMFLANLLSVGLAFVAIRSEL